MAQVPDDIRDLQDALQVWLNRSNLATGACWYTPDEYHAEFYPDSSEHRFDLALLFLVSHDAADAVSDWDKFPGTPPPRPDAPAIKAEFESLLKLRAFEYDFDGRALYFMRTAQVQAAYDRDLAKQSAAQQRIASLIEQGWVADGEFGAIHPHDPERRVLYNPFAEEWLISPKQAMLMTQSQLPDNEG
jgi:hypothetical protein